MQSVTGILLVNMGTPASPGVNDVRAFLKEFLSDPRIMGMPAPIRWSILNFFILPFRPARLSGSYKSIWTEHGSPLIHITKSLVGKLSELLPAGYHLDYAMRYGRPSIHQALNTFQHNGINKVYHLPLYPQYASSSTGSAMEAFNVEALHQGISSQTISPFYNHPSYINALYNTGASIINKAGWDHVIFSFHGLPESHIRHSQGSPGHCLRDSYACCEQISDKNANCYRAQCTATARALARQLNIPADKYTICFQSRFGPGKWIKPATAGVLESLPATGCKKVIVFAPSFVADCLETLEELDHTYKGIFLNAGGESFLRVSCLNAETAWAEALRDIIINPGENFTLPA